MERRDRTSLAAFCTADETLVLGAAVTLGEDAARHMAVRRIATGDSIRLLDGRGRVADATVIRLSRNMAAAQVERVSVETPLPPVHLLVPIADRDRMLWLAEKATELAVTSWRPVLWKRSRSVKPRGEGPVFMARVRQRMMHALEQCGGSWLPAIYPDATCERAMTGTADGAKLVLDAGGDAIMTALPSTAPVTLAVGPEGGFDPSELDALSLAGFRRVRLEGYTLRFETAATVGLALARAALHPLPGAV